MKSLTNAVRAALSLLLFTARCAFGLDIQFDFDPNGNLANESAAIVAPPHILAHPQSQVAGLGALTSFIVVAADTRMLDYEWRFNNAAIGGATNDTLLLTNVGATNEGLYTVVLVNPTGSVTSAPAVLMIDSDGDGLADSWELANFGDLNQNPSDDFDGDGVPNSDEFQDGTSPTNSASAQFRLTVLADGGLIETTQSKLSYTNGEAVTLTAVALAPEIFHGWTGDVLSRTNPLTLIMNSNTTLFAHFQPKALVWTNLAGGSWHEPSNWQPAFVPTAVDEVFLTSSSPTISANEPADCAGLTFGNASGTSNPTLTGSGTLTVHSNATWLRGNMSGSGRTIIGPGATLTMNNSPDVFLNTRTLENGGTVLWTGAGNLGLISAVITNRAGALFHVQSTVNINNSSGVSRFDNAGTFRKSSSGTTHLGPDGRSAYRQLWCVRRRHAAIARQSNGQRQFEYYRGGPADLRDGRRDDNAFGFGQRHGDQHLQRPHRQSEWDLFLHQQHADHFRRHNEFQRCGRSVAVVVDPEQRCPGWQQRGVGDQRDELDGRQYDRERSDDHWSWGDADDEQFSGCLSQHAHVGEWRDGAVDGCGQPRVDQRRHHQPGRRPVSAAEHG